MSIFQTELSDRRVLQISGADRVDFLQNLVTQNIADVREGACVRARFSPLSGAAGGTDEPSCR